MVLCGGCKFSRLDKQPKKRGSSGCHYGMQIFICKGSYFLASLTCKIIICIVCYCLSKHESGDEDSFFLVVA